MKNKTHTHSIRDLYRSRTEPEALLEFARFFWSMLLISVFIISSLGIAFGAYQYIQPLPQVVDTGVAAKPIFESTDLESILAGFTKRATDFEIRRSSAGLKDPSIPGK